MMVVVLTDGVWKGVATVVGRLLSVVCCCL